MNTTRIQFHQKISLNICFLELSEEFHRDSKNEFESPQVNEPFVRVIEVLLFLEQIMTKQTHNVKPPLHTEELLQKTALERSRGNLQGVLN